MVLKSDLKNDTGGTPGQETRRRAADGTSRGYGDEGGRETSRGLVSARWNPYPSPYDTKGETQEGGLEVGDRARVTGGFEKKVPRVRKSKVSF